MRPDQDLVIVGQHGLRLLGHGRVRSGRHQDWLAEHPHLPDVLLAPDHPEQQAGRAGHLGQQVLPFLRRRILLDASAADPAGLAMAFKLIEAALDRWRAVNAPHLVALVGVLRRRGRSARQRERPSRARRNDVVRTRLESGRVRSDAAARALVTGEREVRWRARSRPAGVLGRSKRRTGRRTRRRSGHEE